LVSAAVWVLTLAVAAGIGLGLWHLRDNSRPPFAAGIAHGVIGTVGVGVLFLALRGPPRGVANGVGSFGTTAAVLFAAALVIGLVLLILRRRSVVMAIHAGIAITAYTLLLAWNLLG
jgi:hypothetical protein